MTPEEFYEEMLTIDKENKLDIELKHAYLDDAMCRLLKELGYTKGVEVFENASKWYA